MSAYEAIVFLSILYMLWRMESRLPAKAGRPRKRKWTWARIKKLRLKQHQKNTIRDCAIILIAMAPFTILQLAFGMTVATAVFVLFHVSMLLTDLAIKHWQLEANYAEADRRVDNLTTLIIEYGTRLKKYEIGG